VERQTRYVMLVKVASKDSETVVDALIQQAHKLPRELYKSLTWDRGSEMAEHRRFSLATDIKVYVCDPQQPWQRGSNENTNGLLRQYFPKGTDLADVSQTKLNAIARRLNERPRQTLGFETRQNALANVLRRSVESTTRSGRRVSSSGSASLLQRMTALGPHAPCRIGKSMTLGHGLCLVGRWEHPRVLGLQISDCKSHSY
jgi:transposase InsO family protein